MGFLAGKDFLGLKGFPVGLMGSVLVTLVGAAGGLGLPNCSVHPHLAATHLQGDNNLTMIGIDKLNQYYLSKILHSIQKKTIVAIVLLLQLLYFFLFITFCTIFKEEN